MRRGDCWGRREGARLVACGRARHGVGGAVAGCGSTAPSTGGAAAEAPPGGAPFLATSLATAAGTWALTMMGGSAASHNNFWQWLSAQPAAPSGRSPRRGRPTTAAWWWPTLVGSH
jgi:hypothetical protein